ncbi:hypothetical protein MIZ03_3618 [Rhodoferax lithotrophicus]|uniref:Uncharacterized protein n=1 Tax=Rhodoferax lithotrophicus TaxID=2798804 RepID=A0ABM7MQW5_9BURK|nr:hypothetical protein MIZ03_3618 [Rhodoferax sp. MIZ03]
MWRVAQGWLVFRFGEEGWSGRWQLGSASRLPCLHAPIHTNPDNARPV